MSSKDIVVKDLQELYSILGLEQVDAHAGFTVHYLQDTFRQLPFRSQPFRPNYFSFLFIRDAFGMYIIDDLQFEVRPLTVYFTNPGNFRVFEWHKIKDTCLITFDEAFLKEYVHADVFQEFSFLLTETMQPRPLQAHEFETLEQLYRYIHREQHGHSPYKQKLVGALMASLLLKIKEYFFQDYNPIYEGNRSSEIVKTFKIDLEQHFRDLATGKTDTPLRVPDYADKQALHVNYLSNVISTKTGKSVSTWIAEKTISAARVMLQNPSLTIKEITARLGFLEAPHFSNYFKKHTGMSPAAYRKQHAETHS